MHHDADANPSPIPQGVARRLVPLRWARSQKLAGYYDPEQHALIYQDSRGRVVDRVALPLMRSLHAAPDVLE